MPSSKRPSLPAEVRKLLKRQQFVSDTPLPAYRLLDILATPEGDVSALIARFRELKEPAMRKAFHDMAALLREMESAYLVDSSSMPADAPVASSAAKPRREKQSDETAADLESLQSQSHVLVFSDGASKGNPGDSGIAYVIADTRARPLYEQCAYIGQATNNEAEYQALLGAMEKVLALGKTRASFFCDSELVVNQVLGRWKIKKRELQKYAAQIQQLRKGFEKFSLEAIPREQNVRADHLATCAIKAARSGAETASEDYAEGGPAR